MNSEQSGRVKTFATFRVTGDILVPDKVTKILKILPTKAYAKGERYSEGPRSQNLIGRTGVWYSCTDGIVPGNKLSDHLEFITRLLHGLDGSTKPLQALQRLLRRHELDATVTCFSYGLAGAKQPSIPRSISALLRELPARIETDFVEDQKPSQDAA